MRTLTRIALSASFVGLAACYGPPPEGAVIVASRPPAYREEVVGVAPGPSFFWVAGFWEWGGAEYRWVPGRWVTRPYARAVWVRGRWHSTRRGWFWTPGHWR
jgi:hypothetical protein